jgi:hypothetical protein
VHPPYPDALSGVACQSALPNIITSSALSVVAYLVNTDLLYIWREYIVFALKLINLKL